MGKIQKSGEGNTLVTAKFRLMCLVAPSSHPQHPVAVSWGPLFVQVWEGKSFPPREVGSDPCEGGKCPPGFWLQQERFL